MCISINDCILGCAHVNNTEPEQALSLPDVLKVSGKWEFNFQKADRVNFNRFRHPRRFFGHTKLMALRRNFS